MPVFRIVAVRRVVIEYDVEAPTLDDAVDRVELDEGTGVIGHRCYSDTLEDVHPHYRELSTSEDTGPRSP